MIYYQRRAFQEMRKMASYSEILLITCLFCLHLFVDGRNLLLDDDAEAFQPLCSRMCHSSADFRDNVRFPYKCSCSQSCAVFDDCCYDSPYKDEEQPTNLDFHCMSVDGVGDFRVVSSCPTNWHGDSCRELFGYLPPVTSRVTNSTYGNAFCASCNEDGDDLITWNVKLGCSRRNDRLDFDMKFPRILYYRDEFWGKSTLERNWRSCKFYLQDRNSRLLNDLELRPCLTTKRVSRCSSTWTDISVEQKCRSYEDPVYILGTTFHNSHCAECNYKDLRHVECIHPYLKELLEFGKLTEEELRSCMGPSLYKCISDSGRGVTYSPADLFRDIRVQGCLPPAGRLCCNGERYDINTGTCKVPIVDEMSPNCGSQATCGSSALGEINAIIMKRFS